MEEVIVTLGQIERILNRLLKPGEQIRLQVKGDLCEVLIKTDGAWTSIWSGSRKELRELRKI